MGLFYNASKPTRDEITEIFVQTEVSHSWRQLWANSIHQWRELCNSDPELSNTFTEWWRQSDQRQNKLARSTVAHCWQMPSLFGYIRNRY